MAVTDPFATLGFERRFDLDREELEKRYRDLQRALHPDKHVQGTSAERRASLERAIAVNEAYRTLRDERTRAEALLRLAGLETKHEGTGGDPEFLMEMMELREALSDARAAGDRDALERLGDRVRRMRDASLAALARGFDRSADLRPLVGEVERLRYHERFLAEIDAAQEAD